LDKSLGEHLRLLVSPSDALSGVLDAAQASFTFTTTVAMNEETANGSTNSRVISDVAGNTELAGPFTGIRVDRKATSIVISTPSAQTYTLNATINASFTCHDGGSGLASCDGTTQNGAAFPTNAVGTKTFAVQASDAVGNSSEARQPYTVSYGVCVIGEERTVRSGAVVPMRVQLCDAARTNVSSSDISVTAAGIEKTGTAVVGTAEDAGNSAPDGNFRFDPALSGYVLI
jgi:hypothetical protein